MKLTFLGTGTSVGVPQMGCHCEVCSSSDPADKRLRASVLLETDKGGRILIDCGPDFRQQSLRYGIEEVDGVLFTHIHFDHAAGINEIRPLRHADLYAEQRVIDGILRFYSYLFGENHYPGAPELNLHTITGPFQLCGETITPVRAIHGKLPVLGFRIGKRFAYLTDFSEISDEEKQKLLGVDVMVMDALRIQPHPSHLSLQQALDLCDELKLSQVYFTHMSHDMGLHHVVNAQLPSSRQLAYDGQVVVF